MVIFNHKKLLLRQDQRGKAFRKVFRVKEYQSLRVELFFRSPSLILLDSSGSVSDMPFLNPRIARPRPVPISGSFPAPKMINTMSKMTMSSGMPMPNINRTLQNYYNLAAR